jgi:hypothetical protein
MIKSLFYILIAILASACASVKMGPLEVEVTESDTPFTVISVAAIFLVIYLGIKIINKWIK